MEKSIEENAKDLTRFRIFKLKGGFEVWVGKDSKANDMLTMRYAKQNDFWFHVSGTSGSHTVLKIPEGTEIIPKEIIKTAASICAYYSKAKNAKIVKVSYTQVKNVQKYKGAKSGSVVIKNEKVIKCSPLLPSSDG
ncbi:MAG: NFACT RNA binding domain-containing protein [Ignavibacteria bacterium]